ncbi:MAG: hypothetical protein U0441_14590 [Polyangiaceae bacterium]
MGTRRPAPAHLRLLGTLAIGWIAAGCGPSDTASSGGSGGGGTTTSSTDSGGSTASGGTGGSGGFTGGGGTGGSTTCTPGDEIACYEGPAGTEGVGVCKAGKQLCKANGEGYGPCLDQVLPGVETCATPLDDDCDGKVNDTGPGCACVPGATTPCYPGPSGTAGVGVCKEGTATCDADGSGYGECVGAIVPGIETCDTPGDDDCDGLVNEEGVGCGCSPGAQIACYSGPAGTSGVGVCKAGTQTCNPDGQSYGPCTGEIVPSAEVCATVADEDCDVAPDCGAASWAVSFGGLGNQQILGVATDSAGATLFAGAFTGSLGGPGIDPLTSAGGSDVLVGKLDAAGMPVWLHGYGSAGMYEQALSVATDASGAVYVTGYFDGAVSFGGPTLTSAGNLDVFVVKLDAMGNHVWSRRFGDAAPQLGVDVAVDANGDVLVLAKGYGSPDFGAGPLMSAGLFDVFVVKLDMNGSPLWSRRFGGAEDDDATAIGVDAAGDVALTGTVKGAVDFGGGALPAKGGFDVFVAKLGPDGAHLWSKRLGDAANQVAGGLAVDANGDVLLTGGFEGTIDLGSGALQAAGPADVFAARLAADGSDLFSRRFGAPNVTIEAYGIAPAPGGGAYFGGPVTGSLDFGGGALGGGGGADAYVVRLDGSGQHVWSRAFGAGADQFPRSLAAHANGDVAVGGYFEGQMMVGDALLASVGAFDVWAARLAK